MDDLRSMLEAVTELELAAEVEPNKRISLKCTLIEIVSVAKISVSIPLYNGRRYPLEVGQKVRVYFKKEDLGVGSFSGLVVSRQLDGSIPLLFIQMVSLVDKTQRRNYFRLPLITDVILKIPTGVTIEKQVNNGKLVDVEIVNYKQTSVISKDISGGGLRALVGERMEPGQTLKVIVILEKERIEVDGEVVRCQLFDDAMRRYDCGIRFLEVEEKDRSRIIAFIFEKQRNLRKKGLV